MGPTHLRRSGALALVVVALAVASPARADDRAAAEELFVTARELRGAGRIAEACDAFERSNKLDPQVGTQYNLGLCYEDLGRLASAWAVYREVVQRDLKAARRKDAEARARQLRPRLTRMLITLVGPTVPGMVVTRNDVDITATVGVETAVDPGDYRIVVDAPGYRSFTSEVRATGEGAIITVTIPVLDALVDGGAADAVAKPDDAIVVAAAAPRDPGRGRRRLGLIVGGGGIAAAGTGLVFGALARGAWRDARAACGGDLTCDTDADLERGRALLADARRLSTTSTVLVAAAAAAVVAGVILYVTAPRRRGRATAIAPAVGVGVAILTVTWGLP
jgi:tetratricopeptide (TPR) repeat protein